MEDNKSLIKDNKRKIIEIIDDDGDERRQTLKAESRTLIDWFELNGKRHPTDDEVNNLNRCVLNIPIRKTIYDLIEDEQKRLYCEKYEFMVDAIKKHNYETNDILRESSNVIYEGLRIGEMFNANVKTIKSTESKFYRRLSTIPLYKVYFDTNILFDHFYHRVIKQLKDRNDDIELLDEELLNWINVVIIMIDNNNKTIKNKLKINEKYYSVIMFEYNNRMMRKMLVKMNDENLLNVITHSTYHCGYNVGIWYFSILEQYVKREGDKFFNLLNINSYTEELLIRQVYYINHIALRMMDISESNPISETSIYNNVDIGKWFYEMFNKIKCINDAYYNILNVNEYIKNMLDTHIKNIDEAVEIFLQYLS